MNDPHFVITTDEGRIERERELLLLLWITAIRPAELLLLLLFFGLLPIVVVVAAV